MGITIRLVMSLTSLMLMGVAGYIAVRTGLLKTENSKPLSSLIVYILTPCMLIHACQADISAEQRKGFLFALAIAAVLQIAMIILARVLRRPMKLDQIEETSMVYTNCGNLLLPLMSMAYGDSMVYLCIPYQITYNILLWTHCISMVRGEKQFEIGKILKNPNIIAQTIGLVMLFTGVKLPSVLDTTAASLGNMVGPGSMIVIGMVVASSNLKTVFTMKRAYIISFLKLIVIPVFCMGILYLTTRIFRGGIYRDAAEIVLLACAAPTGATISQFAVIFDREPLKAGVINILCTFLCVITMPLMILLFRMIA